MKKVYRVVGWYVHRIEDKCEEIVHYFLLGYKPR